MTDDRPRDLEPEPPPPALPGLPAIPAALAQQALRHGSHVQEQGLAPWETNQRLEFLGDAVLGFVVAEYLYQTFPDRPEGALTRIKASVVSEPALARVARNLRLGEYLWLGRGEEQSGGRDKPSILADALEALIGAAYLAAGLEGARRFIHLHFVPLITERLAAARTSDHKTALQELTQRHTKQAPSYVLERTSGPDHAKRFYVRAESEGLVIGRGGGKTRKAAEQAAARKALQESEAWLPQIAPAAGEEGSSDSEDSGPETTPAPEL